MSATLKQIAEKAGVSIRTVSEILNGKADRYRDETCRRVQAVARELRYRPNGYARAIRQGRFGAVALVSSAERYMHVPEPVLIGLHRTLAATGTHLVFSLLEEQRLTEAAALPRVLAELMVDGLVINWPGSVPPELARLVRDLGIPAVWLNHDLPHDAVRPDDRGMIREATEQAIALGHRALAWVDLRFHSDPLMHYSRAMRHAGFVDAMRAARLPARLVTTPIGEEVPDHPQRVALMRDLLRTADRPTALFCNRPGDAGNLIRAASELGLRVGGDLSIVVCAERPFLDAGIPCATVIPRWYEVGDRTAALLLRKIADPSTPTPSELVPGDLDPGLSLGPPS